MSLFSPDISFDTNDVGNLKNYRLDFMLYSYSINANQKKEFSGLDTYSVEYFKKGIGFGITNIEIDTNASLQPVIEITFKDLYGNSVFLRDNKAPINYSSLFDWPPPKFDLSFKGYLGRTTRLKLNLKKTDISYNSSDGSFTIKCSFVPNIWGPFADMPAMFLYAVKSLKLNEKQTLPFDTFIDLIKIGDDLKVKTKNISDKYTDVEIRLADVDYNLASALSSGSIKPGSTIDAKSQTTSKTIVGFVPINIYNTTSDKDLSGDSLKKISNDNAKVLSEYILLKSGIAGTNSNTISYTDYAALSLSHSDTTSEETYTKLIKDLAARRAIVDSNANKINDEINAESATENQDKISKVVISKLFSKLGGDTGYILGRILQAGIQGYENAQAARDGDDSLIGKYFPLQIDSKSSSGTIGSFKGAQIPVPKTDSKTFSSNATNEWDFVNKFIQAISTGIADSPGVAANIDDPTKDKLVSRINNLEILQENPYIAESNSIVSNLIIRSGIWSYFTNSTDPNNAGGYYEDKSGSMAQTAAQTEVNNNIKPILKGLTDVDLKKLIDVCSYFVAAINDSGNYFDPSVGVAYSPVVGGSATGFYSTIVAPVISILTSAGIPNGIGTTTALVHNNLYWTKLNQKSDYCMLSFPSSVSERLMSANSSTTDNTYSNNTQAQEDPNGGLTTWNKNNQPPGIVKVSEYAKDKKGAYYGRQKYYNHYVDSSAMFDYLFFTNSAGAFNPALPGSIDNTLATSSIKKIDGTDTGAIIPLEYLNFYGNNVLTTNAEKTWAWALFEPDTNAYFNHNIGAVNQRIFLKNAFSTLKTLLDQENQNKKTKTIQISTRAQKMENEIYTQFHHIFYQWYSLIYNDSSASSLVANTTNKYNSNELPQKIEKIYSSYTTQGAGCSSSGYETGFQYIAPLIKTKSGGNIDVENSVINIDSCNHIDANTTVMNIIQNICTHNNFLFFPIAGGDPYNLQGVFEVEPPGGNQLNFGNRFVVMWSPTPEARTTTNSGKDFSFIQSKQDVISSPVCAFEVRIGSTDNALFKNLNVSTDSTKTTAESIANLQKLVDPKVQEKFETKDCSTLSIIEGRSYTCEIETLGNAQISPMQYFYLDNMPIFGGLYQIMGVKHNITPNNMTTTFKGMKMRFNAGKYGGIPPVTLKSLSELAQGMNITTTDNKTPTSTNTQTGNLAYQPYPGGPSYKGIDISDNNPDPIDWSAVLAGGISFVYFKVSEGLSHGGALKTKARAIAAQNAGLKIGYYHFARPGGKNYKGNPTAGWGNAVTEANFFNTTIERFPYAELLPVLDFEDENFINAPNETKVKWAEDYITQMKTFGRETMLYCGYSYFDPSASPIITSSNLWIAGYWGTQQPKSLPKGFKNYTVWQNTDKLTVPGITGNIDGSLAYIMPITGRVGNNQA